MFVQEPSQRITVEEVLLIEEVQDSINKNRLVIPDFLGPLIFRCEIIVRLPNKEEEFPFKVKKKDTIRSLKRQVEERKGLHLDGYVIYYEGSSLEDNETFDYYNIKENSVLFVKKKNFIRIKAISLAGFIYEIESSPESRISEIREYICNDIKKPSNEIALIFAGRQLNDDHTLADYGIGNKASLRIVSRLKGG